MTRSARACGVLAISVALVLTACSSAGPEPASTRTPAPVPSSPRPEPGPSYVAIGDSYTAGGLIGSFQPDGLLCQRSTENYPSLVAEALDLTLTDVSCGGASSADVLQAGRGLPAQIDAVTEQSKVVTVSVGGNDFGLYGNLIGTCPNVSKPGAPGAPCRDLIATDVGSAIPAIGKKIGTVLDAVRTKAPRAEILVVGYPRLMPRSGTCKNTPYAKGDVAWLSSVESDLSAAMASAAASAGVAFVPMHARSKGHDLCSGDAAWVNGLEPPTGDGAFLHPNAAGEKAMADAVAKELEKAGN